MAAGLEKWYALVGLRATYGAPRCATTAFTTSTRGPRKLGLTVRDFGLGTRGFAAPEDKDVAVCVLPGTELSFAGMVRTSTAWGERVINYNTSIFRQHALAYAAFRVRLPFRAFWVERLPDVWPASRIL
jgi:hypothetical protein